MALPQQPYGANDRNAQAVTLFPAICWACFPHPEFQGPLHTARVSAEKAVVPCEAARACKV
jgi:hypothetical protein